MTLPPVHRDAGHETDVEIAEKVMGWPCLHPFDKWEHEGPDGDRTLQCGLCGASELYPPRYSTDIAAAWLVVEAMGERGFDTDIEWKGKGREYEFTAEVTMSRWENNWRLDGHGLGTAPLAICLAALAAIEKGS